jgi:hypothetical protein
MQSAAGRADGAFLAYLKGLKVLADHALAGLAVALDFGESGHCVILIFVAVLLADRRHASAVAAVHHRAIADRVDDHIIGLRAVADIAVPASSMAARVSIFMSILPIFKLLKSAAGKGWHL